MKRLAFQKTCFGVSFLLAGALLFGCTAPDSHAPALDATSTDFDTGSVLSQTTAPPPPVDQDVDTGEGHALISFAGDCTLSNIQGMSDFSNVYNSQGAAYFLGGVAELFAHDDLTVVNLEGPLTDETSPVDKGEPPVFWFRSPPEYVEILKSGGVEACNLANNHTLDYGSAGLAQTKEVLDSAGIGHFGFDDTLLREVNGIRIGFFGFAFDSNAYNIRAIMDSLWADGAEVIVAYFHDGIEREYAPSSSQIAAAHTAIDYGASAVIMSHPHVIQGVEYYNDGFIAYSLGNFCYGGHTNPADKDSMVVQLEFTRTAESITCEPQIIPCSLTSTPETNDYRPRILDGEEATRVLDKITELSL
jgi:poly-gamma-glutamate synthesis protein (capsule biosynthesis protein)